MKKELPWIENPKQLLRLNMKFQKNGLNLHSGKLFLWREEADVMDRDREKIKKIFKNRQRK